MTFKKAVIVNNIYYSQLRSYIANNAFRNFSLKLVLDGQINCISEDKNRRVNNGSCLIATQQPFVWVDFESKSITRNICIDFCQETVNKAFAICCSEEHNLDNYLQEYLKDPQLHEHIVRLEESSIKEKLAALAKGLQNGITVINPEWFLHMVEKIAVAELLVFRQVNQVLAKKPNTRREIYKRVLAGRNYMDENFLLNPGIGQVATICALSSFHFYRSFKQVFRVTPYQYMLKKRLQYAMTLMKEKELNISAIAKVTCFPDVQTFSRAFKREHGISPSYYRHQCCNIDLVAW